VRIEQDEFRSTLSEMVDHVVVSLDMHGIYVEGNIANISPTIAIDISRTPGKLKTYISVWIVRLRKFISTPISSRISEMYFLGRTKRCQGSTPTLLNMKLKLIQMLKLFEMS
jgi:hypothetical protein